MKNIACFFTKNVAVYKIVIIFVAGFVLPDFPGLFLMQDGDVPGTALSYSYICYIHLITNFGKI